MQGIPVSRRTAIVSTAALASGGLFAVSSAQPASGQVEANIGSFIMQGTTERRTETPDKAIATIDIETTWTSDDADSMRLTFNAGYSESDNEQLSQKTVDIKPSGSDTFVVEGDLLTLYYWDKTMLDPEINGSFNAYFELTVELMVGDQVIDSTTLSDTADIGVNGVSLEGQLDSLDASGNVTLA
jgi:hypothetical protein